MTTQAPEESKPHRKRAACLAFTDHIERLCRNDPGARAALRAGLRRDLDHPRARDMHRLLTPLLRDGCDDRTAQAHYTVASLIAAQPRHAFVADQDEDEDEGAEEAPGPAQKQTSREDGERGEGNTPPKTAPYGTSYGTSFGTALGHAVTGKGTSMRLSAAESSINRLTRQSIRGIHLHLPAAVNQVRTTGTVIDWGRLLADLVDWPYRSGRISRHWLQDFYRITARIDQD
ncbi:type I-E CRISPR-associated protein Cse2/CasB [Streptomyces iconiensis]|uniref:Type I-E CRISPR-associated protein Cse2/CasB n=1 Tax=Streptomyces iconiensis TaxID=1384038 RepID=A0ABT6ZNE9_9ACTN|nr:type I-E CRISPR-associated protein Cse2/CasB [Streptomyces iconiensis]MDJ1130574.1 type I-E CRISPR-associated protein Cse2/CasB [Streptomyces iconiensis]